MLFPRWGMLLPNCSCEGFGGDLEPGTLEDKKKRTVLPQQRFSNTPVVS